MSRIMAEEITKLDAIIESQAKEIEGLRECLSWILRLESNCSIKVVQGHIIRTHMDTQPDKGNEFFACVNHPVGVNGPCPNCKDHWGKESQSDKGGE